MFSQAGCLNGKVPDFRIERGELRHSGLKRVINVREIPADRVTITSDHLRLHIHPGHPGPTPYQKHHGWRQNCELTGEKSQKSYCKNPERIMTQYGEILWQRYGLSQDGACYRAGAGQVMHWEMAGNLSM